MQQQEYYKETAELNELANSLRVHIAYTNHTPIKLRRIGKDGDGGYVVPEVALQQADAIIGYGIHEDSSFEEGASEIYNKISYRFDCTKLLNKFTNRLFHFIPICIAEHEYIKSLPGNKPLLMSFDQQLSAFHLKEKNLFIKMDIEGNEHTTLPDILKHSSRITGIVFELHIDESHPQRSLRLIKEIEKDFVLIHIHGHNGVKRFITKNADNPVPLLLELTYINKNLAHHIEISPRQSHPTELDMPCSHEKPEAIFEIYTEPR